MVIIQFSSRTSQFTSEVYAHILPKLVGCLPSISTTQQLSEEIQRLKLADPEYFRSSGVQALFGADIYGKLLCTGVIQGDNNTPTAQATHLGWILSGKVEPSGLNLCSALQSTHRSYTSSSANELIQLVKSFWMQEEDFDSSIQTVSPDDQWCMEHFNATHTRNADGRYIVRLPFKSTEFVDLSNSKTHAIKMMQIQEGWFKKDALLYQLYSNFLHEYSRLKHMVISPPNHDIRSCFYLPHHGVKKESSSSTKLRVVFNGSQRTTQGISLNDLLHEGPCLLNSLIDVIMRWRTYQVAFSADVEKMYRQIQLHEDDQKYQRIVWRDSPAQPMQDYTLTTVTYGLKPAPFMALAALRQLEKDEGKNYPLANSVISQGSYVDDVLSGADTVIEAQEKIEQLNALFKAGGFPLKKWLASDSEALKGVPVEDREDSSTLNIQDNAEIYKQLGLKWDRKQDTFTFSITTQFDAAKKQTKREVLSKIAQLFDPLGWITPVIIQGKIFLQKLWEYDLDWDQQLDETLSTEWQEYHQQLKEINNIQIPRWLFTSPTNKSVEIHGFSDASNVALGAVAYLRVTQHDNSIVTTLVMAKSKVAPLQRRRKNKQIKITTPRLELLAAVLLTKLIKQLQSALDLNSTPIHLWTDSSIVHYWVKEPPTQYKQFVSNRIALIQEAFSDSKSQVQWHHVPGRDNPADIASRGTTPATLQTDPLWWNGPTWLNQEASFWPTLDSPPLHPADDLEKNPVISAATQRQITTSFVEQLLIDNSSLSKAIRLLAWWKRYVQWRRSSAQVKQQMTTPLSTQELQDARNVFIRVTQRNYFIKEINLLKDNQLLPTSSSLIKLTPYLDDQELLRVGSRLNNASLSTASTHPLILPSNSRLTTLLLELIHKSTLHGSTQLMLATLRQRYWIIGGRTPVRNVCWRCTICARHRGIAAQQLMGQLPPARCNINSAFINSGVDFAGPFTVKVWSGRIKTTYKAYLAVFVCFATSAVHLELVTSLSSEAFIAAYRRFTSTRGICKNLYSDCGTNFVGADKELQRFLHQSTEQFKLLRDQLLNDGTTWHFNPPGAPHHGGKWEAAVKSMKYHLIRAVGATLYTYEQLDTLIKQISAQLNSRPLCPVSDDPEDLQTLTPGHFLIGRPLNSVPDASLSDLPDNRLSRWQLIQKHAQQIWTRWTHEYLTQFHARSKWTHPNNEIQVNSMVLLMDERYPPSKWPLARVITIHPGKDGLTRVVTIRTATTTLTRPIAKLCILPMSTPASTPTQDVID